MDLQPSWGYIRLVAKGGATGPGIPCRYLVRPAHPDGVDIDYAVAPEHVPTQFVIARRVDADLRHTPALFNTQSRMIYVLFAEYHCAGSGGTFTFDWQHRAGDGWYCTPGWPGVQGLWKYAADLAAAS